MPKVEIYTTMFCPYCARARTLLQRKGVEYTEIDIIDEPRHDRAPPSLQLRAGDGA